MMLFHDSDDPAYRGARGAAPAGGKLSISIKCDMPEAKVYLRLWWQNRETLIETAPRDGLYSCEITLPNDTGVMWYFFIIDLPDKRLYYGNARDCLDGEGEVYSCEPPGYQITIYDPNYKTPEWMRDSVLYQIMPDRFFASKPLEKREKPYMGWMHKDWNERVALSDGEANDFFGGDIKGIEQKLDYLKDLGVGAIYLNPIFRARSNHKYDTGDYMLIDPSFGTREDFESLCKEACSRGIRIMLDGVFSHTGAISRYFNIDGSYDDVGAYQSPDSPYAKWYDFKKWPDEYECWWGFKTLPDVRETEKSFLDFITGPGDSVMAHWLNAGANGWRLDVADELPMDFIRSARRRVKSVDENAALLGEVWEDASNKLAYGQTRCYCLGDTLDSVMNYPLREIAIGFMLSDIDSRRFQRRYGHLMNAYPKQFFYSLMNLLGSHDKPRIIDVLSGDIDIEPPRAHRRYRELPPEKYELGRRRYIALWRFICSLPGMPCVYYADEAGQTGMADPFCRATYPWGAEDEVLLSAIAGVNKDRNANYTLRRGDVRLYAPHPDVLLCARYIKNGLDAFGDKAENSLCVCALNRSDSEIRVKLEPDDVFSRGFEITVEALSSISAAIY